MLERSEVVGEYREDISEKMLSESSVSMKSDDLYRNWRRVSLSSDFFGKYYSYFFPYQEKALKTVSRDEAENSISFVLNELVENTAKYSNTGDKTVQIQVRLLDSVLLFDVSNYVDEKVAGSFIALAREIINGDPEELYMKQLEKNIEDEKGDSGLGYLTLINDYKVTLGFKFDKMDRDVIQVTVQAKMKYKEA
jgi:hypothetical protein